MDEEINVEYQKALSGLRLEFGNLEHIRIADSLKRIAKYEREKQTPKVRRDIIDLKKTVIYLIKMDF